MNEFPKSYLNIEAGEGVYSEMDVDYWFKRCVADRPNSKDREFNLYYNFTNPPVLFTHLETKYLKAVEAWSKRWFSQFIENHDKEERG